MRRDKINIWIANFWRPFLGAILLSMWSGPSAAQVSIMAPTKIAPFQPITVILKSDRKMTVRIHLLSKLIDNKESYSWAEFDIDKGENKLKDLKPKTGTYRTESPYGLLYSHSLLDKKDKFEFYNNLFRDINKNEYILVVENNENIISISKVITDYTLLDSESSYIETENFRARIYRPQGPGPYPAIIFIGGNPHKRVDNIGFSFTNRGYVFIHVIYHSNTTKCFNQYPVESIIRAVEWLKSQDYVNDNIGIIGISRGAEVIPIVASHLRGINYSILINFSAWALPAGCLFREPAWSVDGKGIDYLPLPRINIQHRSQSEMIVEYGSKFGERYVLPFRNLYMETLFVGSEIDEILPSENSVNIACNIVGCNNDSHYTSIILERTGHNIMIPPWTPAICSKQDILDGRCDVLASNSMRIYEYIIQFISGRGR